MITPATIREHATVADEAGRLSRDEERSAGGWRISFPAGIYRPIYCTISGTIYRPERPVRVNGVPWEHAGLLITHDGIHAFQFNENQVLLQVLNQPLQLD